MLLRAIAAASFAAVVGTGAAAQEGAFSPLATEACLARTFDAVGCIGVSAALCATAPGGTSDAAQAACYALEHAYWEGRLETAYQSLLATAQLSDRVRPPGTTAPLQAPAVAAMQTRWEAYRDAFCAVEQGGWGGAPADAPVPVQCLMTLTALQVILIETGMEIH